MPFHDRERITNFRNYHEEIKEYFNFNKSVQFQVEKCEEMKTFQLEKGKYSN